MSPETSFSFGFDAGYAQLLRVGEDEDSAEPVAGTDRTFATFRVGVSTLASRHGMLQVNLGIGLTSAVPRFDVNVAVQFRF